MNCAELDTLLCDYVDGTLGSGPKAEVEQHLAQCARCSEMARDAAAAVAFMERASKAEPPPELITRILFDLHAELEKTAPRRGGLRAAASRFLHPILQPRFAMGMAMTILSFSMLGRFAGINVRQLKPSDLDPVKVWEAVDDRVHRTWARAVKFYEGIRLVYEVRSRLRELTAQEDEAAIGTAAGGAEAGEPQKRPGGQPRAGPTEREPR